MMKTKVTRRPLVLISVMLAMFMGAVEATIVATAMPSITSDLGGFSRYSWVFSAYLLMSTITVLIYGKLADLFGRKLIFFIGVSLFLCGSLLSGFATSMEQLIVYRLIQGLGAGAVQPIATIIIGDIYQGEERAKVQGYLSSVWGISAVSGPAIGGILVETIGWQYVFWVNIPLGLIAMIGIGMFLNEQNPKKDTTVDYKGAILLTTILTSLLFWLVEGGQSFQWRSITSLSLILVVIIGFYFFLKVEKRASDPFMPFSIWRNKTILFANLISFCTGIILIGLSSYIPMYVTGVMEQKAIVAGFTLTAVSIGWPIASTITGRLLTKHGASKLSLIGTVFLMIGTFSFILINPTLNPILIACCSFIVGIGMGLTSTSFIVTIQGAVGHELRGVATASNLFMRNFGNTVGAAFLGTVVNHTLSKYLKQNGSSEDLSIIDRLLDEKERRIFSEEQLSFLRTGLDNSLHDVFLASFIFAIISFVLVFGIPKKKGAK
ncbi:MDR family MFS transporter [Psychrobacillus sp. FJAT-51614]|uniref:MDR family MFS transporter n=1 Tax=Psychrobacillus mangrovi TaxID=3117745 RepID=A0ABU8F679_9BACI